MSAKNWRIFLVVAGLLVAASLVVRSLASAPVESVADGEGGSWGSHYQDGGRGRLFAVEKDGRVFARLLGTLHVGEPEKLGLYDKVIAELRTARTLVVEVTPEQDETHQIAALQHLPASYRLDRLVGRHAYSSIKAFARHRGIDLASISRLRPLTALTLMQFANHIPARSLDDVLIDVAKSLGISVRGLESWDEMISSATCLTLQEEAQVLKESLRYLGSFDEVANQTLSLYVQGRLYELFDFVSSALPLSDKARKLEKKDKDCLIDKRNARMGPRLLSLMDGSPIFVAVGAFHLVGKNGLIAQLEARGFAVKPLAEG